MPTMSKKRKSASGNRRAAVRRQLERSIMLLPDERSFLQAKLPAMTTKELAELEEMLTAAEAINWSEELPAYEHAVEEMVGLSERTEAQLLSFAP